MKKLIIIGSLFFSINAFSSTANLSIGLEDWISDSYRTNNGFSGIAEVFLYKKIFVVAKYSNVKAKVDSTHADYAALNNKTVNFIDVGLGAANEYTIDGNSASNSVALYYALTRSSANMNSGFGGEIRQDFYFIDKLLGVRIAFEFRTCKIPFEGGESLDWQSDITNTVGLLVSF